MHCRRSGAGHPVNAAIRSDVSSMAVNNECGSLSDGQAMKAMHLSRGNLCCTLDSHER